MVFFFFWGGRPSKDQLGISSCYRCCSLRSKDTTQRRLGLSMEDPPPPLDTPEVFRVVKTWLFEGPQKTSGACGKQNQETDLVSGTPFVPARAPGPYKGGELGVSGHQASRRGHDAVQRRR